MRDVRSCYKCKNRPICRLYHELAQFLEKLAERHGIPGEELWKILDIVGNCCYYYEAVTR